MNPLLSIIVPIYNAEEYLHRCIDSILNQTYKNLEIILIDDGSSDKSPSICDEYKSKDDRTIVIHQKNTGVTPARKAGILASSGEYIGFVDSDDWLESDMYEQMISLMCKYLVDIVQVRHFLEYSNQSVPSDIALEGLFNRDDDINPIYENFLLWDSNNNNKITGFLWDKLFTRAVIEKYYLSLPNKMIYFDDAACVYSALPFLNSIYISNLYSYHYNQQNISSISKEHGKKYQPIADSMELYLYLENIYKSLDNNVTLMNQLYIFALKWLFITSPLPPQQTIATYLFPCEYIMQYKKVVLYGAGKVGISYLKQFQSKNEFKLIGIVDKQLYGQSIDNITIINPEFIQELIYDIIIIAVEKESIANSIKEELLLKYFVNENKIIWKKPRHILDI